MFETGRMKRPCSYGKLCKGADCQLKKKNLNVHYIFRRLGLQAGHPQNCDIRSYWDDEYSDQSSRMRRNVVW
jgi:hypothetical protein